MSQPPGPRSTDTSRVALVVTALVYVVLAARQQAFVGRNAVDVMYFDSFDIHDVLFHGGGWWASFDQQFGPHRQGVGGLLIRVLADLTRWDTRYDAQAVSLTLIAAVPLGVWLAWRCGVRGWPLVAVPVLYLNARQYEMFVAPANPAHGALPVLLVTAICLAYFVRRTAARLGLLVGLTFCAAFTGFGLFAALLTPPLLALEYVQARHAGRPAAGVALALAGIVAVWVGFAYGYRFDAASNKFAFPFDRPVEYLYFVGALLGNAVGAEGATGQPGWGTITIGLLLAAAGLGVAGVRGARVVRGGVVAQRADVAVFILAAFGVLFTVNAAIGRTPEGWETGIASRYVTLCIPTGLAVLLHLSTAGPRWARRLAVVYGVLVAVGTVSLYPGDTSDVKYLHDGCLRWRAAYLLTQDVRTANHLADFQIYRYPYLGEWLRYLARHQLNMFDPTVFGPTPPRPRTAADALTPRGSGGR